MRKHVSVLQSKNELRCSCLVDKTKQTCVFDQWRIVFSSKNVCCFMGMGGLFLVIYNISSFRLMEV